MQVILNGESLKAFMKNLSNILRVGERVEITVLKKNGKNSYLVEIKGNIFEAFFSKDIDNKTLVAHVKLLRPHLVLKSEKDDIEIKLVPFGKRELKQAVEKSEKLNKQRFILEFKNEKEKNNSHFSKGEVIRAEVAIRKPNGRYILRMRGSLFEALSRAEGLKKGDKIVLLVERVNPDIVLKMVDADDSIEFLPASKVFKGSEGFLIAKDEHNEFLLKLEQSVNKLGRAFENDNLKEVVEAVRSSSTRIEKFLEPFDTLKRAVVFALKRLTPKDTISNFEFAETSVLGKVEEKMGVSREKEVALLKNLENGFEPIYKDMDAKPENETLNFDKPFSKWIKPKPEIIAKIIQAVIKSADEQDLIENFGTSRIEKIESDLKSSLSLILPIIASSGNNVKDSTEVLSENKSFIGMLERIAEQVDLILKSGKTFNDSLLRLVAVSEGSKKSEIKALENLVKEKGAEFSKVLKEISTKSASGIDVDTIKNAIKHAHGKFAEPSLFIQIPLILNNREENIFVRGKKENEGGNNSHTKKRFSVKIVSNSKKVGFFQIDALYLDGKIACSVGFEKENVLESFKNRIDDLKVSLGSNVSLDIYLIKKAPKIVKKQLDIKT